MKIAGIFLAVLASAAGLRAQGLIYFNNNPITRISTNAFGAQGPTAPAPNSFYYALFYSTTASTVNGSTNALTPLTDDFSIFVFNDSNWHLAAYGTNLPAPGRFVSAARNTDFSTAVSGVLAGSSANFVVLGWSANLGTNLPAMLSALYSYGWPGLGFLGESAVSGPIILGDGGFLGPPASLFGIGAGRLSGFTLGSLPIPEPSTLALTSAGVVGWFLLRCRMRKAG
jgi:hypothetical protein